MANIKTWAVVGTLGLGGAVGCGDSEGETVGFRVAAGGAQSQALSGSEVSAEASAGISLSSSDGQAFTLTKARVNLRDIELDLPEGMACADIESQLVAPATCKGSDTEDGGKIVLAGPFVIDLMAGTSAPDLSAARIPAGVYKRIDYRIEEAKENLDPSDELFERSFVAQAGFQHQGQPMELKMALDLNEDHRIESSAGVEASGAEGELLLRLDASKWLAGVPVGTCLEEGKLTSEAGIVLLDDDTSNKCSDLENALKDNIKRSADLTRED